MASTHITMLGTGNATVTRCYNTCFFMRSTSGESLLVDAGGGNQILSQLEKAGIRISEIHDMYISHCHTDHILGAVWILRMVIQAAAKGKYDGALNIWGHEKAIRVIRAISEMTLPGKITSQIGETVILHEIQDGEHFSAGGYNIQAFDLGSTKEKQFGFRGPIPGIGNLVFLGDEPYREHEREYLKGADLVMCEAFCLYADREIFKPYEKHHSTAKDAARTAEELRAKSILLYHTEDTHIAKRKELYSMEAAQEFTGKIFVPDDLETLVFEFQ